MAKGIVMPAEQSASADGPLITYTLFPNVWPKERTERADVPWKELVQRVYNAPTYLTKSACPLISLAEYGDSLSDKGYIRHADNVRRIYGVEIDYDGEEVAPEEGARRLQTANLTAIVYTSPSHTAGAPRWRALLPLEEPSAPQQRSLYVARVNRALGGIATRESFTLSQSFYIGRVRGAQYVVIESDGRCIDQAADLEPLYYTGHSDGASPRDERSDDALRAAFEQGHDRYQAMLKLSARWAARGMATDDIKAALGALLGDGPGAKNADGIDLHTRIAPMAESAVAKFGGKPSRHYEPETIEALVPPDVELPPIEAYIDDEPVDATLELAHEYGPPTKSTAIDWDEIEGHEPPPRIWRVDHWLGAGPMLLAGAGGIGKSLLAQTMATALALGRNFIDRVSEPQTVLMWLCEDDRDEIWRRQVAICRFFGVPLSALKGRLIIEPRIGKANTLMGLLHGQPTWTSLREELVEQVNDYRATILMLDNIGQTYGGIENDRHQVTTFVNGLSALTPWPLSTMLLAHPAKAAGSEYSGSTAWENAVRMRWFLGTTLPDQPEAATAEDGVRFLAKRKANYSVHDWRRLTYQDGALVPDAPPAAPGSYAAAAHRERALAVVLSGLARLTEIGIPTTHAANSPAYLPRKLVEMKLAEDYSRNDLARAMNDLLADGRIEIGVVGKYDKGGKRTGLLLAGTGLPK